jgi:hypothetical protein
MYMIGNMDIVLLRLFLATDAVPLMPECCSSQSIAKATVLARIMHHMERFCTSGRRSRADDPSVWIGVRQLAVQRVWD